MQSLHRMPHPVICKAVQCEAVPAALFCDLYHGRRTARKTNMVHTCNAAGLGKTTIAHVVARHCGYRPFEINASDDRTANALQSRIQDAVQMQSVLGKRQMNLVIVDEVDGIAGAIANVPCNNLFDCMLHNTLVLQWCCKTPNIYM